VMAVKWKLHLGGEQWTCRIGVVQIFVGRLSDGKYMSHVPNDDCPFVHSDEESAKSAAISRARERLQKALKELEDAK
jgi:hypothetical protein